MNSASSIVPWHPLRPPCEPALPAAEEAALIAGDKDGDPVIALRRARVLAMLRRAATPEGVDAELIALLAAARALPLDRREDWLSARQRLVDIGKLSNPPPGVSELVRKLGVAPGAAGPSHRPSTDDPPVVSGRV